MKILHLLVSGHAGGIESLMASYTQYSRHENIFLWLYVNSWGREKKQIIASRVGVKAPARFLCTAEEDSASEIAEVTDKVG